jgi:hypothetical protein
MPILVLLYILICYKIDLPVYWYDWALFALLEIYAVCSVFFSQQVKEAYDKGVREGARDNLDPTDNMFSDVEDL